MTRLVPVRPDDPAAQPLFAGLAEEYARLYGAKTDEELSAREAEDFVAPRGAFMLAFRGRTIVAGGGVAPLSGGFAEIKRMWTSPQHRRLGLARRILTALEHEARELGYHTVQLQTGMVATPAVALYESAGYRRIPPFGRYRDEQLAVAYEKRLT